MFLYPCPKSKQAISSFVIQCTKFPYLRVFQLLEEFFVAFSTCNTLDVVVNLVRYRFGETLNKVLCLVCQDKFEDILCHTLSFLYKGKHIVS